MSRRFDPFCLPTISSAIGVVRGLADARELQVVRRLDELAAREPALFPQDVVAKASRTSLTAADRLRDRAAVCDAVPELGAALAEGEQTASGFRRTVDDVIRKVRVDDGLDRLLRQQRMARLKWWLDIDGMWNLAGKFDPATGARLEGRLRNEVERQFASSTPDTCPVDPVERQQHLAALAFADLLLGDDNDGSGSGAPDVTVVIDERTLRDGRGHEGTVCTVGLGRFGLPVETIRRWACIGSITPVVCSADGTRLLLGRETRLANRAQRRALRVFYSSCALCDVPFDHCQIHHVSWFSLGGLTDVENLLPVCSRHHHLVHEGGWILHLAPDRTLTVTHPDGTTSVHDPPSAWAA